MDVIWITGCKRNANCETSANGRPRGKRMCVGIHVESAKRRRVEMRIEPLDRMKRPEVPAAISPRCLRSELAVPSW